MTSIQSLIDGLRRISPMPDDGEEEQTVEVLDKYDKIMAGLIRLIDETPSSNRDLSPQSVIDAFGYGEAYGVYWTGIELIRRLPKGSVLRALRESLLTGQPGARQWSATLLGQYQDAEAYPVLIRALSDPMPYVRAEAALSLGMIGDNRSIEHLEKMLEDQDEDVRDCSLRALNMLGH